MALSVTITASNLLEHALAKQTEEANDARPKDGNGQPIGAALTPAEYLQARVNDMLLDYARRHARISGAAFIDRFTAAEWSALKAARGANAQLAAAAAPLLQGQRVELAGPLAQNGIALLVSLGILTSQRGAAMLAPPAPGEAV